MFGSSFLSGTRNVLVYHDLSLPARAGNLRRDIALLPGVECWVEQRAQQQYMLCAATWVSTSWGCTVCSQPVGVPPSRWEGHMPTMHTDITHPQTAAGQMPDKKACQCSTVHGRACSSTTGSTPPSVVNIEPTKGLLTPLTPCHTPWGGGVNGGS
jgi:hypothetical protein